MTAAPLHMVQERLLLDPAGAAFVPGHGTLVVADLHLEKGSAAARTGSLLPPWDTRATLDVLAALLRRYRPAQVVALGDSFHDRDSATRLLPADRAQLKGMTASCRFIWVLGNHDPAPPEGLGGEAVEHLALGRLTLRHIGAPGRAPGEISGHFHPKAQVLTAGTTIARPCFVGDGQRLLLPALGAYTGGLDVRHPAIAGLFPRGGRMFLLGRDRVFSFPLPPRTGMPAMV